MRTRWLVWGLLAVAASVGAETPPAPGIWAFLSGFELEGCAEFDNARGAAPVCRKTEKRVFQKGELLPVDEFLRDDGTHSWGAKLVYLGQVRSIPVSKLEKAVLPPDACEKLRRNYEGILSRIHRGCVKPSDCVSVPMQWNVCEPAAVFSKDVRGRYRREDLEQQRRLGHLACLFTQPPCQPLADEVICHNSQCGTVEGFFKRNPQGFSMQFFDLQTGALRMNQPVVIRSGGRRIALQTDPLGKLVLGRSLLQGKLTIEVGGKSAPEMKDRTVVEILSIPNGQVRF